MSWTQAREEADFFPSTISEISRAQHREFGYCDYDCNACQPEDDDAADYASYLDSLTPEERAREEQTRREEEERFALQDLRDASDLARNPCGDLF